MEVLFFLQGFQNGFLERLSGLPGPPGEDGAKGDMQELASGVGVEKETLVFPGTHRTHVGKIVFVGGNVVGGAILGKPSERIINNFLKVVRILAADDPEGLEVARPGGLSVEKVAADAPDDGVGGKLI